MQPAAKSDLRQIWTAPDSLLTLEGMTRRIYTNWPEYEPGTTVVLGVDFGLPESGLAACFRCGTALPDARHS